MPNILIVEDEEAIRRVLKKVLSEDDSKNFEKNIQKLTDQSIENIEKILSEKEKEIIQI